MQQNPARAASLRLLIPETSCFLPDELGYLSGPSAQELVLLTQQLQGTQVSKSDIFLAHPAMTGVLLRLPENLK